MKHELVFGSDRPKTTYILPANIQAIQIIPDGLGRMRLGTILQLPEGVEVEVCGEGFDDRTTKISWQGGLYYIFTEDVEPRTTVFHRLSAAG